MSATQLTYREARERFFEVFNEPWFYCHQERDNRGTGDLSWGVWASLEKNSGELVLVVPFFPVDPDSPAQRTSCDPRGDYENIRNDYKAALRDLRGRPWCGEILERKDTEDTAYYVVLHPEKIYERYQTDWNVLRVEEDLEDCSLETIEIREDHSPAVLADSEYEQILELVSRSVSRYNQYDQDDLHTVLAAMKRARYGESPRAASENQTEQEDPRSAPQRQEEGKEETMSNANNTGNAALSYVGITLGGTLVVRRKNGEYVAFEDGKCQLIPSAVVHSAAGHATVVSVPRATLPEGAIFLHGDTVYFLHRNPKGGGEPMQVIDPETLKHETIQGLVQAGVPEMYETFINTLSPDAMSSLPKGVFPGGYDPSIAMMLANPGAQANPVAMMAMALSKIGAAAGAPAPAAPVLTDVKEVELLERKLKALKEIEALEARAAGATPEDPAPAPAPDAREPKKKTKKKTA